MDIRKIRKEIQYKIKNRAYYNSIYYLATIKTEEINKQREQTVVNKWYDPENSKIYTTNWNQIMLSLMVSITLQTALATITHVDEVLAVA